MALSPPRPCRWPGCPEVTRDNSGYCEQHRPQARRQRDKALDEKRGSARHRGYDRRWEHFRAWFLQQHPLCERCLEHGRLNPAELVHHKQPVRERPDLRLVPDNCQAVCTRCHAEIHRQLSKN